MENHKPTQNQRILDYIKEFGSITQLEALRDLGVMRLASRISDLRRQGYNIVSERETVLNRYGETCHPKRYSIKCDGNCQECKSAIWQTEGWYHEPKITGCKLKEAEA